MLSNYFPVSITDKFFVEGRRFGFLVFCKKDLHLVITQKLIFSSFHEIWQISHEIRRKTLKSDNSTKTCQFHRVQ